ncbi:MAG: VWA domain-containing protein [Akkermansiaceae bacterium]
MNFSNISQLWWFIPALIFLGAGFWLSLVDRPKHWKIISFAMRLLAVLFLILALCKPFSKSEADNVHVVYLVDGSASVSPAGIEKSATEIEESIASLSGSDTHSIYLFASETKKVTINDIKEFAEKAELDGGDAQFRSSSNLSSALLTTRLEFPSNKARRLVLFSDGVPTDPDAANSVNTLKNEGIEISFLQTQGLQKAEAAVTDFRALVPTAYEGEIVRMQADITTSKEMKCSVRLLHQGVVVQNQDVTLSPDKPNKIGFDAEMTTAGISRWAVEIQPEDDHFPANNQAKTNITVSGTPRILVIHKEPKAMREFTRAMRKQGIEIDVRGANGLPVTLQDMLAFKAIILADVPATDLTVQQLTELKSYVSDFGGGLGMLGSENSFGLGGYYQTPIDEILPLTSRYEKEKQKPSLAMVLVIDKSGSMQGVPIQLARTAAKAAVDLLGAQDQIAVIGFDGEPQVIVEMSSASAKATILDSIDTLDASGGTNLYPAFQKAKDMLDSTSAKIKHIIILSDGHTPEADYIGLAEQLAASRVTISTVAMGEGAARELMAAIAETGKGRYYETNDPANVPQIFTKETMQASKSAIKEDLYGSVQIGEHPLLNGFETAELPFIMGYVMTQAKPTAKVVLAAETGDPLLATSRYGLGTTFAYTSDLSDKWGSEWLSWSACSKFWDQTLRSILRKDDGRGISTTSNIIADSWNLNITRKDDANRHLNKVKWRVDALDGKGNRLDVSLQQTGLGSYQTSIPLKGKERIFLQLTDTADGKSTTLYWQRPYPAEYQLHQQPITAINALPKPDLTGIRNNLPAAAIEKDSLPTFALIGIALAIGSIYTRRI